MLSDPADIRRFRKQVRRCSFCGKVIESPEEAEYIVTRNWSPGKLWMWMHTGCVYATKKIRRIS